MTSRAYLHYHEMKNLTRATSLISSAIRDPSSFFLQISHLLLVQENLLPVLLLGCSYIFSCGFTGGAIKNVTTLLNKNGSQRQLFLEWAEKCIIEKKMLRHSGGETNLDLIKKVEDARTDHNI